FNDTFYLASDEAFSRPGATITLHIVLNDPPGGGSTDLRSRWETWNAATGTWVVLGETGRGQKGSIEAGLYDPTEGFTVRTDDAIKLTLPADVGPVLVNGQLRHWIRVRIVAGNYGTEAHYEAADDENGKPAYYPGTRVQVYALRPATFQPPVIRSITI